MRIAFCTCVEIGRRCIEALIDGGLPADVEMPLLITLADDAARSKTGRVDLDDLAERHGAALLKIGNINDDVVIDALRDGKIDWLFVVGWSQIVGPDVLRAPARGCIGAHPTLLPKGRGRAPIPWAIIKGLDRTGVTFFRMDEGVDSGDIVVQREIALAPDETSATLYERATDLHASCVVDVVRRLRDDPTGCFTPQDASGATYWPQRRPADGRLEPSMSVDEVDRLVRGCTRPYPGAFIEDAEGRIVVWRGHPRGPDVDDATTPKAADSASPEPGVLDIDFADGRYAATEWERVDSTA